MPCDQFESMNEKVAKIMDIQAEMQAVMLGQEIGPNGVSYLL